MTRRHEVKDRARDLMDRYPGYTFGAVFQATLLLGTSTTVVEMEEIATELNLEYLDSLERTES